MGGVIDLVEESIQVTSHNGEKRYLWRVTLSSAYATLIAGDLPLHYDPAPLAKIERGISQAIARHVMTHRNRPEGGWSLDKLIKAVGAGNTAVELRNRRREINQDAENLLLLGITVKDGRVFKE